MSEEKSNSLVSLQDVLGIGQATNKLIGVIQSGVGALWRPQQIKRESAAQLEATEKWLQMLTRSDLPVSDLDINLQERAFTRLLSSASRHQANRESVAEYAIEEFIQIPDSSANGDNFNDDWIEYFWRTAETYSEEKMQRLFGRILALSSKRVAPFSARLIAFIQLMDATEIAALVDISKHIFSYRDATGEKAFAIVDYFGGSDPKKGDGATGAPTNRYRNILGPLGVYVESGIVHPVFTNEHTSSDGFDLCFRYYAIKISGVVQNHNFHFDRFLHVGGGVEITKLGSELWSICEIDKVEAKNYVEKCALLLRDQGAICEVFEVNSQ